jgi:hypothetical protein
MLELLRMKPIEIPRSLRKTSHEESGHAIHTGHEIWEGNQATAIQVLEISAEMHPASAITRCPLLEGYAGGNTEKSLFKAERALELLAPTVTSTIKCARV